MQENLSHERLIAKLQHFADSIHQRKIEKEVLSIILENTDLKSEIRSEILIYEQIINEYHDVFKDILCR